jgi:serine/threonine-protein kinase
MGERASTSVDQVTIDTPASPGPAETPPSASTCFETKSPIALVLPAHFANGLGRFQIQEILGEGTFGTVYRAHDPLLDRCVALKVAKASVLSAERAERFRREARASAGLRHPHIVPLFETGEAAEQFYLASAHVPGMTLEDALHERAAAGGFTAREAAEIVRKLADALGYAHGQGVVHRDVKSANVMLDPQGEPHLLDFGLALRNEGADRMTLDGSALGTPAYLAPEVATGRRDLWGPATDQYALGVVLYELLTGQTPFAGPVEVVMTLQQTTEPPPPSKVKPSVPRDLEAVCLKCLEKDPARRYADCQALAADLRRWLDGESTLARPAGVVERAAKWGRRNPAVATLSAAVVTLFFVGFGLVTWQWYETDRARQSAEFAKTDATTSAATAKAVNRFVDNLFKSATPEKALGHKVTVEEVLASASRELGTLTEQPRTDAAVRQTLGNAFRSLGDYERAKPLLYDALALRRRDLGADHLDTLESAYDWALLLHTAGKLREAEASYRELVANARRTVAADDALALKAGNGLGLVLQDLGQSKEAEELFRAVLATRHRVSGERDPETLGTMNNLAKLLYDSNRLPEAEELFTQTLKVRTQVLSSAHPKTLESMNNLAALWDKQGRWREAKPLYEQALAGRRQVLGPGHEDTLGTLNNLARLLAINDPAADVIPMFRECVEGLRRNVGPEHPDTLNVMSNLAPVLFRKNDPEGAESTFKEILASRLKVLGPDHADTLMTRTELATVLSRRGKLDEAVPMMRAAWEGRARTLGPTDPGTLQSAQNLGYMLLVQTELLVGRDKVEDAAAAVKSAGEVCAELPSGHWLHLDIEGVRGGILMARKQFKEAEPLVLAAYEKMKDDNAAPLARRQVARDRLIRLYDLTDRQGRAAEMRSVPR